MWSFLAEMGFVSEEVFEEDSRGARGVVLRAAAEHMIRRAAEHAAGKINGVRALEVGDRVDRKGAGLRSRRGRLITLHSLLGRRHEGTS